MHKKETRKRRQQQMPIFKRFRNADKQENLPVLADIETPLKLKVLLLIVVNEAGDGVVVATGEHAGRSLLLLDCWML